MEEKLAEALRLLIHAVEDDDQDDDQTISQPLWDVRSECRVILAEYDSNQAAPRK